MSRLRRRPAVDRSRQPMDDDDYDRTRKRVVRRAAVVGVFVFLACIHIYIVTKNPEKSQSLEFGLILIIQKVCVKTCVSNNNVGC